VRTRAAIACACAAAIAGGCVPALDVDLGSIARPDDKTLILVVENPSGQGAVAVLDVSRGAQSAAALSLGDGARLAALFTLATLDELQVSPGVQPPLSSGASTRPPPKIERAYASSFTGSELTWTLSSTSALPPIGLHEIDAARCAQSGGCVDSTNPPICSLACKRTAQIAAPMLPDLLPCAHGWTQRATGVDGVMACEPPPIPRTASTSCAVDGAVFLAGSCEMIGAPCGAGDFASDIPNGNVIYVRPGPGQPLAHAIASAPPGAILALAQGTFRETVALQGDLTLLGACVAKTVIQSPISSTATVVGVRGQGNAIKNLRIEASGTAVAILRKNAALEVGDVVISGPGTSSTRASSPAVFVFNAGLTAHNLVVRDSAGAGISLIGAEAALERTVIERCTDLGLQAYDSTVTASVSALRSIVAAPEYPRSSPPTLIAIAVDVEGGTKASFSRLLIESTPIWGVYARGKGTSIHIEDSVVRDLAPGPSDQYGDCVDIAEAASATVAYTLLERCARNAIAVDTTCGAPPSLSIHDAIIRDTSTVHGAGLSNARGIVDGRRLLFERTQGASVLVGRYDCPAGMLESQAISGRMSLTDTVILGSKMVEYSDQSLDRGEGISISEAATLNGARLLIHGADGFGIEAAKPDTRVTLADLTVEETSLGAAHAVAGSDLQITRARLDQVGLVGLCVDLATAELADVTISGASVGTSLKRRLDLPCGAEVEPDLMHRGIGARLLGGALGMERFSIRGSTATYALSVRVDVDKCSTQSTMTFDDGEIAFNRVGAALPCNEQALQALRRVSFHDNSDGQIEILGVP
jgi:hypothetical protein